MKNKILSFLLVCTLTISTSLNVAHAQYENKFSSNDLIKASNGHDETFFKTQKASIEKYNKMLIGFDEINKIPVKNGTHNYDNNYGGSYIDNNGELVVLITNNNAETIANIKKLTGDNNIKTDNCTYSYNELMNVIETINYNLDNLCKQGVMLDEMYMDICSNQVIIAIRDLDSEKEKVVKGIIDKDFMVIKTSDKADIDYVDIKGGYEISGSLGSSTLGFGAIRNGVRGYVIAGHATMVNSQINYNGAVIGTTTQTAYYNYSTADAAFVAANSNGTVTNDIMSMDCWAAYTYDIPEKTGIYMYGKDSGLQYGTVDKYNYTSWNGSYYITNQVLATYYSQSGDSGAPVFLYDGNYGGQTRVTLIGINKGFSPSENRTIYTKYSSIVNELGIAALTN